MAWSDKVVESNPLAKTLRIKIVAGEHTCASKSGEFCKFFGTTRFGTLPVCWLFPSPTDGFTVLEEKDGWTQRCAACKDAS